MKQKIIVNHNMAADKTGDFDAEKQSELFGVAAVGVTWRNVTGTLNGTVKIYATTEAVDESDFALIRTITISSASNANDKSISIIRMPFGKLKVVYEKTGITGGTLNCDIMTRTA